MGLDITQPSHGLAKAVYIDLLFTLVRLHEQAPGDTSILSPQMECLPGLQDAVASETEKED